MKVLITGIEGFTGKHLARAMRARGHDVFGLARSNRLQAPQTLVADLSDLQAIHGAVDRVQPDAVVHLAAIAFVAHGDVQAIYRTNVAGSRNLLEALATSKKPPRSVLIASSANVYGNTTSRIIDESVPPAPANDYAVSKLAMEFMAALWQDRLRITIVRPFNYTGVGQSLDFLMPKIVDHFKRRVPLLELGNLDVERDFSDVRTVVHCYARLIESKDGRGTFNVCSGIGFTLNQVLDLAADIAGFKPEIRVNPAFVRSNEVKTLVGSKAALETVIGPIAPLPLQETLQWMMESGA